MKKIINGEITKIKKMPSKFGGICCLIEIETDDDDVISNAKIHVVKHKMKSKNDLLKNNKIIKIQR